MSTASPAPDQKDFDLAREVLNMCDARQAYQAGLASAWAWHHGLHVTRKLLLDAIGCRGVADASIVVARWLKRRGVKP